MKKKLASRNLGTHTRSFMPDGNSILSQLTAYYVYLASCRLLAVVQIEAVVTFCLYHLLADGYLGCVQPFDLVAQQVIL